MKVQAEKRRLERSLRQTKKEGQDQSQILGEQYEPQLLDPAAQETAKAARRQLYLEERRQYVPPVNADVIDLEEAKIGDDARLQGQVHNDGQRQRRSSDAHGPIKSETSQQVKIPFSERDGKPWVDQIRGRPKPHGYKEHIYIELDDDTGKDENYTAPGSIMKQQLPSTPAPGGETSGGQSMYLNVQNAVPGSQEHGQNQNQQLIQHQRSLTVQQAVNPGMEHQGQPGQSGSSLIEGPDQQEQPGHDGDQHQDQPGAD
jgi:hypothetical protein